ncbi:DUF6088 family protein [Edaphobacter modestus]|uniref:AbiEi antitoxin of type IV toxin-antitoxin system n=1 Tax=Edaphobacter modestus TaxID=388466 RepID=A0A4Q7YEK4_9BACT|nr:DUF6088 family protein [Edaphobacter modestus]RZU35580.1 hypothetical protein BDD14_5650 [Edaphobacter modestus]
MEMPRHKILRRLKRLPDGSVFSAKDLLDLASRTTVDVLLAELAKAGTVRRIGRGLYELPKFNAALGAVLSPDIHNAAQAIARRQRWKIVPEGAWAANLLGLSQQVPAKLVYLSSGPKREVQIGGRKVLFKYTTPKTLTGSGEKFSLVVQALRYLGKDGVGPAEIEKLRATLTPAEKKKLLRDTQFGADWIYDVAKTLAEEADA